MDNTVSVIRERIARQGVSQDRVAQLAGYDRAALSRFLRGLRRPPQDFHFVMADALDALEAADRAADEARRRVLAEHGYEVAS